MDMEHRKSAKPERLEGFRTGPTPEERERRNREIGIRWARRSTQARNG